MHRVMLDWMGRLAERVRSLAGGRAPSSPTSRLGARGERAAARHLKAAGYEILERNYRTRLGEIDLVAFRDGVLAFVEVRTQTAPAMIDPLHTITRAKQRRVIKAAQAYATLNRVSEHGVAMRFDVVTVLFARDGGVRELRHLENAFQQSPRAFT
jgi:putative endonuclease